MLLPYWWIHLNFFLLWFFFLNWTVKRYQERLIQFTSLGVGPKLNSMTQKKLMRLDEPGVCVRRQSYYSIMYKLKWLAVRSYYTVGGSTNSINTRQQTNDQTVSSPSSLTLRPVSLLSQQLQQKWLTILLTQYIKFSVDRPRADWSIPSSQHCSLRGHLYSAELSRVLLAADDDDDVRRDGKMLLSFRRRFY